MVNRLGKNNIHKDGSLMFKKRRRLISKQVKALEKEL